MKSPLFEIVRTKCQQLFIVLTIFLKPNLSCPYDGTTVFLIHVKHMITALATASSLYFHFRVGFGVLKKSSSFYFPSLTLPVFSVLTLLNNDSDFEENGLYFLFLGPEATDTKRRASLSRYALNL